jgi:Ca-activated chloride channel family protein
MPSRLSILSALWTVLPCVLAQQPPSIHVDVRLINVAFTVRDEKGTFVTDLAKEDFEILDDGAPQPIAFFARSTELPLNLGLVLDMSSSQEHFIKRHKHDLETFLKTVLTPRDSAFLLCFGNHLRVASDFSPSAKEVMEGLNHYDHKMEDMAEIGPHENRVEGTAFYDALYYSSNEKLSSKEGGRRAIVIFSDGEDNSSAHHMLDVIEAAQGENVVIFGMRYTESRHGRLTGRNKYGMRVMERLGRETGGADFDAEKDDLKKSFHEIDEQLRSTYELGYYAAPSLRDGTFHKLVVRPKRPGVTVRAKTGYFARGD